MSTLDEILEHHGIKGMHWGVRRSQGKDGTVASAHPVASSEDSSKATKFRSQAKASGTHTLSNQELQHLVSRMNLEQQYSKLIENDSSKAKIRNGHKAARDILSVAKTIQEVHSLVSK